MCLFRKFNLIQFNLIRLVRLMLCVCDGNYDGDGGDDDGLTRLVRFI